MRIGLPDDICKILRNPLKRHSRQGPGGNYSYVKGSDVIRRLNEAFGHCWSSEKISAEIIEDQVLMLVSLTVFFEADTITHQGYGSAPIARRRSDNVAIDIGNVYKSAFTSALKKAAEQFGIGLDEDEDAVESGTARPYQGSRRTSNTPKTVASPPKTSTPMSTPAPLPNRKPLQRPGALPPRGNGSAGSAPAASRGNSLQATAVAALKQTPAASPRPSGSPSPYSSGSANIPAPDSTTQVPSFLPEGSQGSDNMDDDINSVQLTALRRLADMRSTDELTLINGALAGTSKSKFDELTRGEAVAVIKYANNMPA